LRDARAAGAQRDLVSSAAQRGRDARAAAAAAIRHCLKLQYEHVLAASLSPRLATHHSNALASIGEWRLWIALRAESPSVEKKRPAFGNRAYVGSLTLRLEDSQPLSTSPSPKRPRGAGRRVRCPSTHPPDPSPTVWFRVFRGCAWNRNSCESKGRDTAEGRGCEK
jgi:hypothetical protein